MIKLDAFNYWNFDTNECAVISAKLKRDYNEDRYVFLEYQNNYLGAIFDGHGGYIVSEYLSFNFNLVFYNIINYINTLNDTKRIKNIKSFIIKEFIALDNKIKNIQHSNRIGSTCVCFIVHKDYFIIINLGDSRLLTYCLKNNTYYHTVDHEPSNPKERIRILKSSNIKNNRINGIINVSRTFGDFEFKKDKDIYKNPITCIPYIRLFNTINSPYFTFISSDSIFEVVSNDEIIRMICYLLSLDFSVKEIIFNLTFHCSEILGASDNMTLMLFINSKNKFPLNHYEIIEINKIIFNIKNDSIRNIPTKIKKINKKYNYPVSLIISKLL